MNGLMAEFTGRSSTTTQAYSSLGVFIPIKAMATVTLIELIKQCKSLQQKITFLLLQDKNCANICSKTNKFSIF